MGLHQTVKPHSFNILKYIVFKLLKKNVFFVDVIICFSLGIYIKI